MILWLFCVLPAETAQAANYNENIRPILEKKCVGCHYSGGPSPFSLAAYSQAKARAELIRTVAIVRSMPPVDAESELGSYSPVQPLTAEETVAIQVWVRNGLTEGSKPAGHEAADFLRYDQLSIPPPGSKPITLRPAKGIKTKAEGLPYWQVVRIPFSPPKDVAIRQFRIRAKTPFVLRQVQLYVDLYDVGKLKDGSATQNSLGTGALGFIGSWSAGYYNLSLPDEAALKVSKGKDLIAQGLYVPTGKSEDGSFEVQFDPAPGPRSREAKWLTLGVRNFAMPWAFEFYTLSDERILKEDTYVSALVPEARAFATQIRVNAIAPNGGAKALLHIASWNRFWPGAYNLKQPVLLRKGTRLRMEIDYDNNDHSALGSGRKTPTLYYGLTERDEMCWAHILCTPANR